MAQMTKENFLKLRPQFKLGELLTESFHPKTKNLSNLVKEDLPQAISLLQKIDFDVYDQLEKYIPRIYDLANSIQMTRDNGGRVYLCGCGATGRLSLAIETFYRQHFNDDFIRSFMAGGDFALIKSVESFEDSKDYGATQIMDLGFSDNDLLLAITEGGETSFVIGACEKAGLVSRQKPYFIYCNPDEQLQTIERSANVLNNEDIIKLNLTVGPMALAGSTRMQATTAQMLAVSFALFEFDSKYQVFEEKLSKILEDYKKLNFETCLKLIEFEYGEYLKNGIVTYLTTKESAITILTDTTERSPTFSLKGFEKIDEQDFSLSYLAVKGSTNVENAWESLLQRQPRCLNWKNIDLDLSLDQLMLFDISENAIKRRNKHKNNIIEISATNSDYKIQSSDQTFFLRTPFQKIIYREIALKTYLNIHSTLLMGLMERYQGNVMTYVKPSNLKLIDRALRYIKEVLKDSECSEEIVIEELFTQLASLKVNDSIVMNVVHALVEKR